ncbi:NAD(+)--rifampin ADP-ribosyltransferase [Streptomyces sp. NPDC051135]|uniref:NAD(+)--rifampin ADP-ribosyltransferase n=1 Tax=unclassified Streptomyces TaxID=2593676 RepID=UPI00342A919C
MDEVLDEGPFFHGTKADLRAGDHLTAGFRSNYRPEIVMNHIYFTALRDGVGLAAELAAGDGGPQAGPAGRHGSGGARRDHQLRRARTRQWLARTSEV